MKVLVSLEFEAGDDLNALYGLHFANEVRVDLNAESPHAVLDLDYFLARVITPAGDVRPKLVALIDPDFREVVVERAAAASTTDAASTEKTG